MTTNRMFDRNLINVFRDEKFVVAEVNAIAESAVKTGQRMAMRDCGALSAALVWLLLGFGYLEPFQKRGFVQMHANVTRNQLLLACHLLAGSMFCSFVCQPSISTLLFPIAPLQGVMEVRAQAV